MTAPVPFGPALLVRPLGVGGVGEVWLARLRTGNGEHVVLKRFWPSIALDIDDILASAHLLRGLRLPHVGPIFEAGVADESAWVTAGFVDGLDARAVLAHVGEDGLSFQQATHIATETLLGLAALHHRGLVHRDVTPANVMIDRGGDVVVVDLDFVCPVGTAATGTVPGTPAYMCPEQAQGLPVDGRTDQYVWAIVAYELFSADAFYGDLDDGDILTLARTGGYRPRRFSSLPSTLQAVLHKALAPDPTDRFPDDASLLAAFSAATTPNATPSSSAAPTAASSLAKLIADLVPVIDDHVTTTPAWTQQQDHATRVGYSAVDPSSVLPVEELSTSVFRPRQHGRRGLAAVVVVLAVLALVLATRAAAKPLAGSVAVGHATPTCSI